MDRSMSLSCNLDYDDQIEVGGKITFRDPNFFVMRKLPSTLRCSGCKSKLLTRKPTYVIPEVRWFPDESWSGMYSDYDFEIEDGKTIRENLLDLEYKRSEIVDIYGKWLKGKSNYFWFHEDSPWDDLKHKIIEIRKERPQKYIVFSEDGDVNILPRVQKWYHMCNYCMNIQWALYDLEFCEIPLDGYKAMEEYKEYVAEQKFWNKGVKK